MNFFSYITYENQLNFGFPFNHYSSYQFNWPQATYTGEQTPAYYANLLILQYIGQRRAYATVETAVTPVIMDDLPIQVQNGFEIGTAVGKQLDVIGKYVGVTRSGNGPNGPITLDDADFTQFIQLAIVNNASDASLYSIQQLLHTYFNNAIFVFDYQLMRLSYYLNSLSTSLNLATLFVTEGLLPRPTGVQLSSVIYKSLPILQSFFSCRTYNHAVVHGSPLNNYTSYQTNYPFLTYADALVVNA